jgi:hypothetical protein
LTMALNKLKVLNVGASPKIDSIEVLLDSINLFS